MSNDELLKNAVCEEYKRELEALPSVEELEEMIQVSTDFHKKMAKVIKKHKRKTWILKIGKNVAIFLLLVVSSFLLLITLNEDVRATCLQWMRTMSSNEMINYKAVITGKENESAAGLTLEYIPEGYVLQSADMGEQDGIAIYYKGNNRLEFKYVMSQNTHTAIDNENNIFLQIELNDGTVCDYYKDQSDKQLDTLVWQRGSYVCTLTVAVIDQNELIRIANEVKIVVS